MPSVIDRLRSEGKEALAELYQTYRAEFLSWIMRYNCTTDEAKDIYQSAILSFYENVVSGKLTVLSSSAKTYLFAIGKYKIMELRRATSRLSELTHLEDDLPQVALADEDQMEEGQLKKVVHCLEKLGEPCTSLLKAFYYHARSMEDIVRTLNYKNTDSAKNQKYKCLQRLRKLFHEENMSLSL